MDQHISGSGTICSGEYDNISISGGAKVDGNIKCKSFKCSGAAGGNARITCDGEFKTSGSAKFDSDIKCESLHVSGSFKCGGDLTAKNLIKVSGSSSIDRNIKCIELIASGMISAGNDIEAEKIKISGGIKCSGLLNAEKIDIYSSNAVRINSIGGSEISIYRNSGRGKAVIRLPLIEKLLSNASSCAVVENSIEGDIIALEYVKAKSVTGRIVAIGEGCDIEYVQYSEKIEINPKAKVGKYEKIQ